ncbi:MAG TPA: MarR family transcriptional regulator [Balneolaceae bacterium]|nr:MarR family transcriptional regulator [Balneolaceae bacterium]|tara:strand:+ start:119791 stop:120288 length:498 start_codon:yes stop_codon:yes gene_type:complete
MVGYLNRVIYYQKMSYENKIDFVEAFSLKVEETGRPRIYGQILGWLLVCEPDHQSFSDLMENLNISKASVSNITRILLETGLIEKIRVPGERQIHFKLKKGALSDFFQRQVNIVTDLTQILNSGLELLNKEGETDTTRITRAVEFHSFLAREIPLLMEKFNSEFN